MNVLRAEVWSGGVGQVGGRGWEGWGCGQHTLQHMQVEISFSRFKGSGRYEPHILMTPASFPPASPHLRPCSRLSDAPMRVNTASNTCSCRLHAGTKDPIWAMMTSSAAVRIRQLLPEGARCGKVWNMCRKVWSGCSAKLLKLHRTSTCLSPIQAPPFSNRSTPMLGPVMVAALSP